MGFDYLREVYTQADPAYTGRVTVPVLYDTVTETVVNNESADIARILNEAFHADTTRDIELYPAQKQEEIDTIIEQIHEDINVGVYKAGFADTQDAYERAVRDLFGALEQWDSVLGDRRFLAGDEVTLADIFLFPTLYRFDAVYHTHFKCNIQRLVDFQNFWPYAREMFVPVGPAADWSAPHDRARLGGVTVTPPSTGQ